MYPARLLYMRAPSPPTSICTSPSDNIDIPLRLLGIMLSPITCEYKGKIAIITIDKSHKLNALIKDEYYLIARYMREIATHDEVFITVLIGKGAIKASISEWL